MRPIGLALSVLGCVISGAAVYDFLQNGNPVVTPSICLAGCVLFLVCWIWIVKQSWIKQPAFAYAERLLESTEKLSKEENAKLAPPRRKA